MLQRQWSVQSASEVEQLIHQVVCLEENRIDKQRSRTSLCLAIFFCITTILLFTVVTVLSCMIVLNGDSGRQVAPPCGDGSDDEPDNPYRNHGVFTELAPDEIYAVRDFLQSQVYLRIKPYDHIDVNTTKISLIELWLPKKSETLGFLDNNGIKPVRNARVVIVRGDERDPRVEEYIVGPLPNPRYHYLIGIDDDRKRNPVPFHNRPSDQAEWHFIRGMVENIAIRADHVLRESYGMSVVDCDGETVGCIRFDNAAPGTTKPKERRTWIRFMRDEEGFFLHPTAFQLLINYESRNTSVWSVDKVYYEGQFFDSVEEFVIRYDQNSLRKRKYAGRRWNKFGSTMRRRGPQGHRSTLKMGPRQYYPEGKRYNIDGNSISYMDWHFDYSFFTSLGLQLFNVNFMGERIAYEMGAHEISVLYSGTTPLSYTTNFFDSQYLLGAFSFEMVRGVDCPHHASYMDAIVFKDGRPTKLLNAICVFEHSTGLPLRRHYEMDAFNYLRPSASFAKKIRAPGDSTYHYYGGMIDNVLIIRTIAAIYNYDYIFDYIFHHNGAIEARVTPTGYIHTAPIVDMAEQKEYGFRVFGDALGTVHNHLVHFKVDLDIQGQRNRFETLDIIPTQTKVKYNIPHDILHQRKFIRNVRKSEKDAALKYNFEKPKVYLMYNVNATNVYGHERAYRLKLNGISKLLLPENEGIEPGISWARYQLAVTRRKENERSSSSLYNGIDPHDPVVNFQHYLDDNESIVDQDLVAWISLGTHHIPATSDVPNTPTTNGHLSFMLLPFNHHDEDPSMNSRDNVFIVPGQVNRHGQKEHVSCIPKNRPFDFHGSEIPV
ncbi:diamine oxidase [copper-containing]-like [Tubulanus polymorphus]|uniref:diamine oxidase [copper-containing]-like n=1 Tax=Tubulanus polymorphus TaxID=672921 RepID=UPI003DA61DA3